MFFSLSNIKKYLLVDLPDSSVASGLRNISQNFTSSRHKIDQYVLDESFVSIYAQTYLPSNIKKFTFILNQLSEEILKIFEQADFYDVGSGPGTYSLAFLERFPKREGSIYLVDSSTLMLKQARKLIEGIFPEQDNIFYSETTHHLKINANKKILFFGNSINEMGPSQALRIVKELRPEIIFFIEPGTKDFFKKSLTLRQELLHEGHHILYPCPNNLKCPLEEQNDWCHQILRVTYETDLERLFQMAQIDRRTMPMISHLYIKKMIPFKKTARIIRFLRESKFSFDYLVCTSDEEKCPQIIEFEFSKKGMSKTQLKSFSKNTFVGDSLNYELVKKISDSKFRVRIATLLEG